MFLIQTSNWLQLKDTNVFIRKLSYQSIAFYIKWNVIKNVNFTNGAKVQIATSCKFVLEIFNTWETEANYYVLF
jgi:hypothetical protein